MNNKIILFDLDDTLISEKDYIDSGFKTISTFFSRKYNLSSEEVYLTLKTLFKKSTNKIFNRLFENYNIPYEESNIKDLVRKYREHLPNIELLNDAELLIKELKRRNIRMGIITDGYKETQSKKIKVLGLENDIEKIIITDELGKEYWKPDKRSFQTMKEYFKCEYSSMIYIGDNIKKDFITPNNLGMISIQVDREEGIYKDISIEIEEYLPQVKVKNLLEVLEKIELEEKNV